MSRLNLPALPTFPGLAPPTRRRRAPQPPPLEPEEERSLLESGLGAVEYIGRTLDKPGAAIRGTLHGLADIAQGDPTPEWGGGLMNLIPFSDTLGITGTHERISGRDLLEQFGAPKNKPGLFNDIFDASFDVGGFATEVATDPLFWMTGPLGSVTKYGQGIKAAARGPKAFKTSEDFTEAAAQINRALDKGSKVGLKPIENPATLAQGLTEGTQSILGVKAPWQREAVMTLADLPFGPAIDKLAAKAIKATHYGLGDRLTGALSAPIRGMRGLLDISAQGKFGGEAQWLADLSFAEARRINNAWTDFAPSAMARQSELLEEFSELAKHNQAKGDPNAFNDLVRYVSETPAIDNAAKVREQVELAIGKGQTAEAAELSEKFTESLWEYTEQMRTVKNAPYNEALELGMPGNLLERREVFGAHMRRRATGKRSVVPGERDEMLVNIPGVTRTINRVSRDELLTAPFMRDVSATLPADELAARAAGELGVGSYVNAADRANIGRITSIDKKGGTANVYFYNKQTGAMANKKLPLNLLTRANRQGGQVFDKMKTDKFVDEVRDALFNNVNPITGVPEPFQAPKNAGPDELRKLWLEKHYLRPEYDEAVRRLQESASAGELTEEQFRKTLGRYEEEWGKIKNGYETTDKHGNVTKHPSKIDQLADYFKAQPVEMRDGGLFPRQILEDEVDYVRSLVPRLATMREVHHFLAQPGVLSTDDRGAVPLAQAWKEAKFEARGLEKFAKDNSELAGHAFINQKAANVLKAYQQVMEPRNEKKFLAAIDPIIGIYRYGLTSPFPAFHVRNRMSGVWQALSEGNVTAGELWKAGNEVSAHMKKGKGLDSDFLNFLTTSEILGGNYLSELGGPQAANLPQEGLLAGFLKPLKDVKRGNLKQKFDPLGFPGVRQAKEGEEVSQNVLTEMTNHAFAYVEALNRAGYAKALWDKGYRPSEIANYVRRSQFDYSELTPFEQNVMKRVYPFWSWTKKNVPYQLKKLAERPGGVTGQTFRALSQYDPEEEYTPGFIKEQLSIRAPQNLPGFLGGGEKGPGETTFVTQTGIPIEDFNKFIFQPGQSIFNKRTVEKAGLSNLHPLLTAGIRGYTGKDPFTGRDVKTLRSTSDALLEPFGVEVPDQAKGFVDRAIQASPFSRLAGTATAAIDKRKTTPEKLLNALSGFRFGTYDVEQYKARDLAEAQKKLAAQYPQVFESTNFFVPADMTGPRAEEARQQVQLLQQLQRAKNQLREKKEREKASRT